MKYLLDRYRKSINPPYNYKDYFTLGITLLILLAIPFTLFLSRQQQNNLTRAQTVSSPCQFSGTGVSVAFCDSFDQPMGTGNRSGQLNGTVWGVSRIGDAANFGAQQWNVWFPSTASMCNTGSLNSPNDVQVCNGQFVETVNDGHNVPGCTGLGCGDQTVLAAYPKQPFDFAGRVGKVVFDLGDDTQGGHAAWPAFALTDKPVPAPYQTAPGLKPYAPNSFGFSLAAICAAGSDCGFGPGCPYPSPNGITVDTAYITTNYLLSGATINKVSCVQQPTPTQLAAGQLNHFEVDILSPNEVDVYGTDAGAAPSTQRLIAKITGMTIPFTRGFIWMEDVHYNACKFNTQCNHTFQWGNVGFDGPLLPRDLSFDVLDRNSPSNVAQGAVNLGWPVGPNYGPVQLLTVPAVTTANLAAAQGAVVTLNTEPNYGTPPTIMYSLNGGAMQSYVFPTVLASQSAYGWPSFALPVPLSQIQTGTNTITINTTGNDAIITNVDLKLVAAGGIPTCIDPSNCSGTQIVTPTPCAGTCAPTPTLPPSPTPTITPTPAPVTTPTFLQEKDNRVTSGNTVNATFTNPTQSGNLIVAYVIADAANTISVSDSGGNTYSSATGPVVWNNGTRVAQVFYAKNSSGGSISVTATLSTGVSSSALLYIHEYAGVDQIHPLDGTIGIGGSGITMDSGGLNTTNPTDLLFSAAVSDNTVTTPGPGYTPRGTLSGNMTADQNVSTLGTYHATATQNGTNWAIQLVAFKAASSGGPSSTPVPTSTPTSSPFPTNTPIPTATPTPLPPTAPIVSIAGCIPGPVSGGNNLTLSWTDTNVNWVNVSQFNPIGTNPYYDKSVPGVISTQTPIGFTGAVSSNLGQQLVLQPNTTYFATVWDGVTNKLSSATPFSLSLCPTPTSAIDTIPPTVTITDPLDGSTVRRGSSLTISANATDDVGVSKVVFSVNSTVLCTLTAAPYTCAWSVPGKRNVTYTIKAVAYDVANLTSLSTVSVIAK